MSGVAPDSDPETAEDEAVESLGEAGDLPSEQRKLLWHKSLFIVLVAKRTAVL